MGQAAPQELDLPQVFGRYLLIKRLSRGGMGEIFLGRVGEIQGFEKPVIIKKVLPHLAADEEFVKRFIDEAQVAIKLTHANVASVYEVGKVDGDYFLALEYVEGRDLRRLLTRCRNAGVRPPPDLCLLIARDLASGLGYAHRRTDSDGKTLALVHCDISPPNVMVSFEGECKVIDFGIAKSAIRIAGSNPNMGFGKFGYMAPEQLVRGGIVDRRTDIYAAGVVLYELLTGERLFIFPEGADYRQIARIVTKGEYIPPSQRDPRLDESFDPLLAKALAPRADDRYQTCEEFRDAIQQKLYQMNPTISADALAKFMRELFEEEIAEERALVASTRDINMDEFRDQVAGSVTHTVTFARAGLLGRRGAQSTKQAILQVSEAVAPITHAARRNGLIAMATAAAMIGGGVLTYLIARGPTQPAVVLAPPTPVKPPITAPVVTPLAQRDPTPPPTVTHDPPRHDPEPLHARKPLVKPHEVKLASNADAPPPAPAANQDEVTKKFRVVKHEYDSFKVQYGARLDGQWDSIVNEITFGKADKYAKVDALLDALRKDMAKVRSGG